MNPKTERQIKILNAETARKIAAGEVIDRPNAIVRELLDNAVDSGANRIDVEIAGGGIDKIRVADNGCGMSRENLLIAAHPHATSKISTETDLLNLSTLGFRGEALASIAAVSRLTIQSGDCKMHCSITRDHEIEPSSEIDGTIVTSENLFENFPARRQFLKRPASETKMCRSTFLEKAMARPDISFRLTVDGIIRNDLIQCGSLRERFVAAMEIQQSAELFYEIKGKADDKSWSFNLVIGDPNVARPDRKDIYIFVNGRRIQEYSLMQAIEYGAEGCFPNGTHPVSALFVTMRPDLVDFNIHPAKKEARFKDMASLHHGVSSTLKEFFNAWTTKAMHSNYARTAADGIRDLVDAASSTFETEKKSGGVSLASSEINAGNDYGCKNALKSPGTYGRRSSIYGGSFVSHLNERAPLEEVADSGVSPSTFAGRAFDPSTPPPSFRYIGKALGTFILVEKNNSIYIIDQHAAHERYLFDKIMTGQGSQVQPLLVPETFELDSAEDDAYMESILPELRKVGFDAEKSHDSKWKFTQYNSMWKGSADELKRLIFEKRVEPKELIRKIAAMTACKAAVKDGYILDEAAAEDLAKKAFELPDPHCPHGRPCWTVITREKLFELVKRT